MGSQQSTARTPVSTPAPTHSMRRLSRMLRRGERPHDDDARAQEELETAAPVPDTCVSASSHHMGHHPPIPHVHGLVHSHDAQLQQAPPTAQTGKAPADARQPAAHRVGGPAVAQSPAPASNSTTAPGQAPGVAGTALASVVQVQAPSTSSAATPAPASDEQMEYGQRVSDDASSACATSPSSPSPLGVISPVEQVQSTLASSHSAPSSDATPTPVSLSPLAPEPVLESEPTEPGQPEPPQPEHPAPAQSEPPVAPSAQSAFTQPDPARIPRTLPLGTTMIVQGLVQTIEVNRPASSVATAPTTNHTLSGRNDANVEEETRPLLHDEKAENGEEREARNGEGSGQSSQVPDDHDTTISPNTSEIPTTQPPQPAPPPTIAPPLPPRPNVAPPSSTDVLGLLLSIAAQATAEALVPWSVPPRSRTLARASSSSGPPWTSSSTNNNSNGGSNTTWGREGIASGLAAAFSALAAAGGGLNPTVREPDTATVNTNTDSQPTTIDTAPIPETTTVTTLPTPEPTPAPVHVPATVPVPVPVPQRRNSSLPSRRRFASLSSSRRFSSFVRRGSSSRRASSTEADEVGVNEEENRARAEPKPEPRRRSRGVLGSIRRLVPWRNGSGSESRRASEGAGEPLTTTAEAVDAEAPRIATEAPLASTPVDVEEAADFGRAPPTPVSPAVLPESSVSPLPAPRARSPSTTSTVIVTPPNPSETTPQPETSTTPALTPHAPTPTPPTTDAEDLIRFSHMLGFTPGVVHPSGTFERFLADMQDELRAALGEYQERVRGRVSPRPRREREDLPESSTSTSPDNSLTTSDTPAPVDPARLLDHTRPHVPSTDPLPLNWWRMYRFPALPDVEVAANSTAGTIVTGAGLGGRSTGSAAPESTFEFAPETMPENVTPESAPEESVTPESATSESTPESESASSGSATPVSGSATPESAESSTTSPATTPDENAPQPVHPAIIIGLRSVSRDPLDDPSAPTPTTTGANEPADESAPRRVRSSDSTRGRARDPWARRFGLRREERRENTENENEAESESEAERRTREGTRNYIIWIIGGYYPSNHPLLAHPNLFLGQVHPDELWMLNEFLGQVKPPTASREDIAKAGLRVVKGTEVQELAKSGSVTENCTERCLICLDDYADEEDLRIMNCKHMFHKDCVDRWMETGRNNCPACRTKGVDTTTTAS